MDQSRFSQFLSNFSRFAAPCRRHQRLTCGASDSIEMLEIRVVPAAIQVTPVAGTTTTEAGGTAQFTVVLSTQPTANVTISLKSSDTSEGTVNVKTLVFTSANWSTPQTFTVKGVDDTLVDGTQAYQVVLSKFKSTDSSYKALSPITVHLTNADDDSVGINVIAANNLQTTEDGGTATFAVKLGTKPTGTVFIPLLCTNTVEGSVEDSLTFTKKNWSHAQTVTVTGVNDVVVDGNKSYQILLGPAESTDAAYSGKTGTPVSITNIDNDVASLVITPQTTQTIDEGGAKGLSFKLTAQPAHDVTVSFMITVGADQATLSTPSITITPANWVTPQNVIITAVSGDGVDGDKPFSFKVDTSSPDPLFNQLPTQTVNATIHDTEF
ncbi:MAG: hypothetical protein JWM11_4147 [Planctomycetaceae bacterium]|nr:hypothetical protein [Planctomycetaceae bacterium]